VLQDRSYEVLGSSTPRTVDVRVVAATNVDLREHIAAGKFREDLFYRLNVIAINLPSLRERREDIPLLAYHFLQKYALRGGSEVRRISPEATRLLQRQPWPGNVRELENAIEHAVVFCKGAAVEPQDLPFFNKPPELRSATGSSLQASSDGLAAGLGDLPYREAKQRAVQAFEQAYFTEVLERSGGNVSEAARQSGLDRSNFRRTARRAGLRWRDEAPDSA
jgi:DNA-binding NtrC family response regulator